MWSPRRLASLFLLAMPACAPAVRQAAVQPPPAPRAPGAPRIVDIMPRYWAFRERTRAADSATTRALFHELVMGPDSNVYHGFSDGPSDATLARYLRGVVGYEPAMRTIHTRLVRELPDYARRFATAFPDVRWDSTTFYIMPWFFISNAGGGNAPGLGEVMIFGPDGIAQGSGADGDLAPLFFHELFHVYHTSVRPADPGMSRARTPLWQLLWTEGLATYVSGRLSPRSLPQDVIMDTASLGRVQSRIRDLAQDVRVHLDSTSQEVFSLYMTAAARTVDQPPRRSGYYIGMLVAAKLAKTHSLPELARLQGPALRMDIETALRELEAGR